MLTPREEALLHDRTVRELRILIAMFEKELQECHVAKRRQWLEVRLTHVNGVLKSKTFFAEE